MEGLNYITNDKGKKTALVISLEEYGEYIEDIQDILIWYKRQNEQRVPLSQVKENLRNYGKLDI